MKMVEEIQCTPGMALPLEHLETGETPLIFRGLASDWPMVRAGLRSAEDAMAYLESFEAGHQYHMYAVPPEAKGHIFYNDDYTAPNYTGHQVSFPDFMASIRSQFSVEDPTAYYVGSRDADTFFPGLRTQNDLGLSHPMFQHGNMLVSVWTGGKTKVAAHYDVSNNIACCMAGRRRFTLYPPDAVADLYPGPLEPTPGGQVLSLVDHERPDAGRFPTFEKAAARAQVAELEPGDVLYFPALWWHQVEALEAFNVMMNYWWNDVPLHIDDPRGALLHSMLAVRDRPAHERKAWKAIFDYYVFDDPDAVRAHLPTHIQGFLAELSPAMARRLRAQILRLLNR